MKQHCHYCSGEIEISYGSYQILNGEYYCWTLTGDRDNCLEQEKRKEQETNVEQQTEVEEDTHTELGKGDICGRCGKEIGTDWEGGN